MGREIFLKWKTSGFATKDTVSVWLESAKKKLLQQLDYGFYKAEMEARIEDSMQEKDE